MIGNIDMQIKQRSNHSFAPFRQLAAESVRFMEGFLYSGTVRALQHLNEGGDLLIPVLQKAQHH
ncbi:hypothetical protein D3C71_2092200 [compost metagenome]